MPATPATPAPRDHRAPWLAKPRRPHPRGNTPPRYKCTRSARPLPRRPRHAQHAGITTARRGANPLDSLDSYYTIQRDSYKIACATSPVHRGETFSGAARRERGSSAAAHQQDNGFVSRLAAFESPLLRSTAGPIAQPFPASTAAGRWSRSGCRRSCGVTTIARFDRRAQRDLHGMTAFSE